MVGSGNAGWTLKSGLPFLCQNCSQGPPAEKTGRESLMDRPSCPPDDPIGQGTNLVCRTPLSRPPHTHIKNQQQQSKHVVLKVRWSLVRGSSTSHHNYVSTSVSPCLCVTVPMCHCVYVSVCHCGCVSLCLCVTVSMCHRVYVSACLCVTVALCRHVYVSPCLCVTMSMCHRVYVTVPVCNRVNVSPRPCVT